MFTFEETDKALSQAKKWMLEHPDFEPKFEKLFNVILNANDETKNMTLEVMEAGDVDTESPAFDFGQYAIGVLDYKKAMQEA